MDNLNIIDIGVFETILLNKKVLGDDEVVISITRIIDCVSESTFEYLANCIVDIYLDTEKEVEPLSRAFYIRVAVNGLFSCATSASDSTFEIMAKETYAYLRASVPSILSSCGIQPLFLPLEMPTTDEICNN